MAVQLGIKIWLLQFSRLLLLLLQMAFTVQVMGEVCKMVLDLITKMNIAEHPLPFNAGMIILSVCQYSFMLLN